jgi:hypothetical protein
MEHMMLRKGDMVRPMASRYRYKGGTLAIVIATLTEFEGRPSDIQILWLNGGFRGTKTWDYLDMFEKVTERNHA